MRVVSQYFWSNFSKSTDESVYGWRLCKAKTNKKQQQQQEIDTADVAVHKHESFYSNRIVIKFKIIVL